MTLIKPSAKSFQLAICFGCLALLALGCSAWLIIEYNRVVDLQHGVSEMQVRLKDAELADSDLKGKVFAAVDINALGSAAPSLGLVPESKPGYFQTTVGNLAEQGN